MNELKASIRTGNKRFAAFMIALVMVFQCMFAVQSVFATEAQGGTVVLTGNMSATPSDDVIYTITTNEDDPSTYTMTISGTGNMIDYGYDCNGFHAPYYNWSEYSKITNIVIEEGVTNITDYFMLGSSIKNISIASTVEEIGKNALNYCFELETINFAKDSKLKTVREGFLNGYNEDSSLKAINNMPKGVFYEGHSFSGIPDSLCQHVNGMYILNGEIIVGTDESVVTTNGVLTIPDGITTISGYFTDDAITTVVFPKSITTIGYFAFRDSRNITEVTIPVDSNIKYISTDSFPSTFTQSKSGNAIFNITDADLTSDGEYIIPKEAKTIASYAAHGNDSIKKVSYEEGCKLEYVGDSAFYYDSNLTSISLPDTVKVIDEQAFKGINITGDFKLPSSIEYIGASAFDESISYSNVTVNIPASCEYIGEEAFSNYNSGAITGLKFADNSNLKYIGNYAFWGHNIDKCVLPSSVEYIGYYAFGRKTPTTSTVFTIEDGGIPYICYHSFYQCFDGSKDYILGTTLVHIGNNESTGKYALADNVEYVNESCFSDACFTEIDLNNCKMIYGSDFSNCTNLQKITIPCNVKVQDGLYFYGVNQSLTIVTAKNSPIENYINNISFEYAEYEYGVPSNITVSSTLSHNYKNIITKATADKDGVIEDACTNCGLINNSTVIKHPAKVSIDSDSYQYTGKAIEPKVTVTDSDNKVISSDNYKVTYSDNTVASTNAKITVTFTGDYYSGTLTKNFSIVSANDNNDTKDEKEDAKIVIEDTSVVTKDELESVKGKDENIVITLDNGIEWIINGKDITDTNLKDIDLSVETGAKAGKTIPVDLINKVTGENSSLNLSLNYSGDFGFKATLKINLEAKNKNLYANLYYYNASTKKLDFSCSSLIDNNGYAKLTFSHASDYVIVISDKDMNPVTNEKVDVKTGSDNYMFFWLAGIVILGTAVFTTVKFRKHEENC